MKDKCISKYTYLKDIRVLSFDDEKVLIKRKKGFGDGPKIPIM